MPDNEDVIKLVEQLRKAIIAQDTEALDRLGRAYAGIYAELEKRVASLVEVVQNMDELSPAQLGRLETYKSLMKEVEAQLTKFQGFAEIEVGTSARAAITAGAADAANLAAAAGFKGSFMRLNPAAIEQLIGFLKTDGALFGRLKMLAPTTAQAVADAFINAVALGDNPRTIAASLVSTFKQELGGALVDVLRMTRTAQIWAYREANRASYIANSDVVTGWIWFADLSQACMGCYAMHGTEHALNEVLDDHYNGHCTMVPITILNPHPDYKKGEEWFKELTPEEQEKRMGPGKYQAWKDGLYTFDQLATHSENEVYGSMTTETPLKDLLEKEETLDNFVDNIKQDIQKDFDVKNIDYEFVKGQGFPEYDRENQKITLPGYLEGKSIDEIIKTFGGEKELDLTIRHEIAHYIHGTLIVDNHRNSMTENVFDEFYNAYVSIINNKIEELGYPTEYSHKSRTEWIAERFSLESAGELKKEIIPIMKEFANK